MVTRPEYLSKLSVWREKQVIKVITGIRRSGKSTLFELYINWLKSTGVTDEQIVYLNLEDMANAGLLTAAELYAFVKSRLCKEKYTYIFIDEIQMCKDFEKAADSIFIQPKTDLYITGSNAYFLSGELATLLSGRYVTIEMLPLSFSEYVSFNEHTSLTKKELFTGFMRYGGFPYIPSLQNNANAIRSYLEGIYNTILIKDVATREKINDISVLQRIVQFLCSATGSPVSIKKISDTLISGGRKISVNTVDHYVRTLTDSYIFYEVPRFDIQGKQILKTLSKFYLADTGFRPLLLETSEQDMGHVLENIVYLELRRRYENVCIGKAGEYEVDFVARSENETFYFQVAATVLDPQTLRRELYPLEHIKDNYPKYLLTLDEYVQNENYNGIQQLNVINWLLNTKQ